MTGESTDEVAEVNDEELSALKAAYESIREAGGDDPDKLFASLGSDIDGILNSEDWVLVKKWDQLVPAHAAAALRHCMVLLDQMKKLTGSANAAGTSGGGTEYALRLLARSYVETWLKGLYLVWGGEPALDAIAADYKSSVATIANEADAYNESVSVAAKKSTKRNKRVDAANADRKRHNELHPESLPLPLLAKIPASRRQKVTLELSTVVAGAETDVPAEDLLLKNVAQRVDQLADERGDNVSALAVYNGMYRFLSTYAGHTTLPVLDSYLNHDQRLCLRVAKEPDVGSTAQWLIETMITCSAILANRLFAARDGASPAADYIETLGLLRTAVKETS